MKALLLITFCFAVAVTHAQTSKELIGKWKLVKQTGGSSRMPDNAFQVFGEGGVFTGINGSNSRKGKWKLSEDNKTLTIKISIISVKFDVQYFDAKKRIISSSQTGTLEYEKVDN